MGVSPLERYAVRPITILLFNIILFTTSFCLADGSAPVDQPSVIIVVGAGGTPEYSAQFFTWAAEIEQACKKGNAQSTLIGIDNVKDSNDIDILKQKLSAESDNIESPLWLIMIGHGTFDGKTAKFNLRGPDVTADELAGWLKPFKKRPVIVVDAFSSSAPFLKKLSAQGRVIITATKSGFEQNLSRFGQYFAAAIADPNADLDKDGQTSLLESFLFASNKLAEFYSTNGRLATEHPLLDDNGDGLGTPPEWYRGVKPVQKATNDAPIDGMRAHQIHLVKSDFESKIPLPLRERRDELELEAYKLQQTKDSNGISEDEYFTRLEKVMTEIGTIYGQAENSGSK
jgi:hypothetical protein